MVYKTRQDGSAEKGNWQLVKDALNKAISDLNAKKDFNDVKDELNRQLRNLRYGGESTQAYLFLDALLKNKDFLFSKAPAAFLQGSLEEAMRQEKIAPPETTVPVQSKISYGFTESASVARNILNFVNSFWYYDKAKGTYGGLLGEAYNKLKDDDKVLDEKKEAFRKECEGIAENLQNYLLGSVNHRPAFLPESKQGVRSDFLLTDAGEKIVSLFDNLTKIYDNTNITSSKTEVESFFKQLTKADRMIEGLELAIKSYTYGTTLDRAFMDMYFQGVPELDKYKEDFLNKTKDPSRLRTFSEEVFKMIEKAASDPVNKAAISLVFESRFGDKGKLLDLPLLDMQTNVTPIGTYEKAKLFYKELLGANGLSGKEYARRWTEFKANYSDISDEILEKSDLLVLASLLYSLQREGGNYKCVVWEDLWQRLGLESGAGYGTQLFSQRMAIYYDDSKGEQNTKTSLENAFKINGITLTSEQLNDIVVNFLDQRASDTYTDTYTLREDPNNPSSTKIAVITVQGDSLKVNIWGTSKSFTVDLTYDMDETLNQLTHELDKFDITLTSEGTDNAISSLRKMLERKGKQPAEYFMDETGKSVKIELEFGNIKVSPEISSSANAFILAIGVKGDSVPSVVPATFLQNIETLNAYYDYRFAQNGGFNSELYGINRDLAQFYNSPFGSKFGTTTEEFDRTAAAFEYMDRIKNPPDFQALDMAYQKLLTLADPNISRMGLEIHDPRWLATLLDNYSYSLSAPEPLQEYFMMGYEPEFRSMLEPKNARSFYSESMREIYKQPPALRWANHIPEGYWKMGRYPTESTDRFRRDKFSELFREYKDFDADRFRVELLGSGRETERKLIRGDIRASLEDPKKGGRLSTGFGITSMSQDGLDQDQYRTRLEASNFNTMGIDIYKLLAKYSMNVGLRTATSGNKTVTTEPVTEYANVRLQGTGNADYTLAVSFNRRAFEQKSEDELSKMSNEQLVKYLDLRVDLYVRSGSYWNRVMIDRLERGDVKAETIPTYITKEDLDTSLKSAGITVTSSQLNTLYLFATGSSTTPQNFTVGGVSYTAKKDGNNLNISTERNITQEELGTRLAGLGINVASTTLDSLYNFITNTSLTTFNFTDENNVSYKATRNSGEKTVKFTRNSDQADMGTIAYKEQSLVTAIPYVSYKTERTSEISMELARYFVMHRQQFGGFGVLVGAELDKKKFVDYQRSGEKNIEEDKDRVGLLFGFQLGSDDQVAALVQKSPSDNFAGILSFAFDLKNAQYKPKMAYVGAITYQEEEIGWNEAPIGTPQSNVFFGGYDVVDKFYSLVIGSKDFAGLQVGGKGVFTEKDVLGGNFFAKMSDAGTLEVFTGRGYYKSEDFKAGLWGGMRKESEDKKTLIGGGVVDIRVGENTWVTFEGNYTLLKDLTMEDIARLQEQAEQLQEQINSYREDPTQNNRDIADQMISRMINILNTSMQTGQSELVIREQIRDVSIGMRSLGENPYSWKVSLTRADTGGRYLLTSTNISKVGPFRNTSVTFGIKTTDKEGPGIRSFGGLRFALEDTAFMATVINDEMGKTGLSNTIIHKFGDAADDWIGRVSTTFTKDRSNVFLGMSNQKYTIMGNYGRLGNFKTAGIQTDFLISSLAMTRAGVGYSHMWGEDIGANRVNVYLTKADLSGSNVNLDAYYNWGEVLGESTNNWGARLSLTVNAGNWQFLAFPEIFGK